MLLKVNIFPFQIINLLHQDREIQKKNLNVIKRFTFLYAM